MVVPPADRLGHIKESASNIRRLLAGKTIEDVQSDSDTRAAFERYLEIISEASRHVPDEWKASCGSNVPWWEIAAFGNIVRHVYERVDLRALWSVYENDLDPLERAIDAMLAEHASKDEST